MKTLFTFALCLFVIAGHAANPSTKSFRATGGLTVASNDITGVIIYDGSGISSPTGGVSATSATNIAKTAVTVGAGTNIVVVTNSTAANTTYTVSTTYDLNVPGQFTVSGVADMQDDVFIGGIADFNAAATFNAAVIIPAGAVNGYVFTTDGTGNGTWQPKPSGSSTNLGVGQTIFLDPMGNDATAQRTNLARPYLMPSNAVAAILSGDTLQVRGSTYLVNHKSSFEVGSAGLSISNKSNIRITGEPGAIWKMSGMYTSNGISGGSMLALVNCTNVLIDNMTFVGFATNGIITNRTEQGFAIALINCGHVTIENCTLDDWHDHGIANMGEFTDNSYVTIRNSLFSDIGGTNHVTLGADGTAINVLASNMTVINNAFLRNMRDFEYHGSAVAKNIVFAGNRSEKVRNVSVMLAAGPNGVSGVELINNKFIGYATNAVSTTARATAVEIWSVSNLVVRGNEFVGFTAGVTYGFDMTISNTVCVDVALHYNAFTDFSDFAVYMMRDRAAAATFSRVSVMHNKFNNVYYSAVMLNANDSRVEANELVDCATAGDPSGALAIGRNSAAFTTNSTNITIVGNKIYHTSSNVVNAAPGIHITAGSWSNIVWGNEVKGYAAMVNSGSNTLTQPINLLAPGAIIGTDNNGRMARVSIGSGVALDTNTMTLTGTGGGGTPGGTSNSVQFHGAGGVFAGNTNFQYIPYDGGAETGNNLIINNDQIGGVETNQMTAFGFGSFSYNSTYVYAGDVRLLEMTTNGHLWPFPIGAGSSSNRSDIGSWSKPWRTNYAQRFEAKESINVGAGNGTIGFSTNFTLEGVATITPSVLRTPTNGNSGVMVALPVSTGATNTNQVVSITLTAGQTIGHNGSTYVAVTGMVANVAATVTGSGTDFTLANGSYTRVDFGTTDAEVSLPAAGTYLVISGVRYTADALGAADIVSVKHRNSTDSTDVSVGVVCTSGLASGEVSLSIIDIVPVTGAKTIQLFAQNFSAARGTIVSTYTTIKYVRLY